MSHDWDAAVVAEGVVCCGEIMEIQRNVDRQHRHNTMQEDANFSCYYVSISVLKLLVFLLQFLGQCFIYFPSERERRKGMFKNSHAEFH